MVYSVHSTSLLVQYIQDAPGHQHKIVSTVPHRYSTHGMHRSIIIKNLYSTLLVQCIQDAQGKQAKYFTALHCNLYKANNFKWSSQTKFK